MAATKSDLHLIWQRAEFLVRPISIGRAEHGLRRGSWPKIAGVTRTHGERWIFIGRLLRREIMGDDPHDPAPSDGWENAWKSPRSWRDRTAIVTPSWRNHLHYHQTACIGGSRPRSTHDRVLIVVRSWPFKRKIGVSYHADPEATMSPQGIAPTTHQMAPTTNSIAHDFWANFPFKKPCIIPLFFNF